MAKPTQEHKKLRSKKTRRGKSKKKEENMKKSPIKFSLLGSNSNGLKAKIDSLKNLIKIFDQPSCITIQETKMRKSFSIQLPGYQIFQLNRSGCGGGLLTAVDEQLDPVLVNADDEVELLIVQVKVGVHQIRVFNAYGPQETNPTESLNFWLRLEQEIIRAKQDNCWILIEMDANAKLDSEFHKMTENGKLMLEIVERQNLVILNKLPICQGQITRHRITKYKEEKAILDYTLTCNELSNFVETMMIDDGRLFTLTKYVSTRGFKSECKSDHNPLFSSFNLEYETKAKQSNRREIFNLKDEEC